MSPKLRELAEAHVMRGTPTVEDLTIPVIQHMLFVARLAGEHIVRLERWGVDIVATCVSKKQLVAKHLQHIESTYEIDWL